MINQVSQKRHGGYITSNRIREGAEHASAAQGNGVNCHLIRKTLILEVDTESLVLCFCVLMYQSVKKGSEWGAVFTTNSGYPSNKTACLVTALNSKYSVRITLSALLLLDTYATCFLSKASPKCSGSLVTSQVTNNKEVGSCQCLSSAKLKQI